tara:strand:+ start:3553 stop:4794 length:1242 start_codon:yes stop_codon:yes gene_type:complete
MFLINKINKFLFPFYKDREIKEIFSLLNFDKKNNVMLVGGCVRNFLNNENIGDIDLATTLKPEEVIQIFSKTSFKIIKSGIDHGTLTLLKNGKNFEITTLREDILTDGRHAKVVFGKDWRADSDRRDFTINAIYLSSNGKLFDPQGGYKDLKNSKIKFIGDPENRIKEDYLRILRFLRFVIQYEDLSSNKQVYNIIKKNLNGIITLSKERVFSELNKIINSENLITIFKNKDLNEIFKIIFPELKYLDRLKKINKKIYKNIMQSEKDIVLALLIIDQSNNHNYFAHKYKVSNLLRDNLNFYHKYFYEYKKNKNFFTIDLKKNIFYHGKNKMKSLAKFCFIRNNKNYNYIQKNLKEIENSKIPEFPVNGKYLLDRGFKSGKKIGEVLKKIELKWIENNFIIKNEDLDKFLKKYN